MKIEWASAHSDGCFFALLVENLSQILYKHHADLHRFSTFIKSSIPWATVKKVGVENRIAKTLRFPRLNQCFLALLVEKLSRKHSAAPAEFTPFLRFENVDIRWD